MKKILKLGLTGLLLSSLNLVAEDNFVTKMVKDKIDKTSININKAIEDDKIYQLHANIGITSLQRENKSDIYELNVDPLYEVTAGIIFFPDTLKLNLSYKTSLNGESSDSGEREQSNSGAKTVMIRANIIENKTFGYLDIAYEDITLNGTLKNTGVNSIYILDKVADLSRFDSEIPTVQELRTNELIATEEKTKLYALNYRLPYIQYIGFMIAKGERVLPVVLEDITRAYAYSEAKGDLLMYGIGYYEDFTKAKKNTLVIEQIAYNRGTMETEMTALSSIPNANYTVEMLAESYTVALGYKFSVIELKLRMDYHKVKGKAVSYYPEVEETELATNFSVGMRF